MTNAKCCAKCTLTDGCRAVVDCINAEESLQLLDETVGELFKWYDSMPEASRATMAPALWERVRGQWKTCTVRDSGL